MKKVLTMLAAFALAAFMASCKSDGGSSNGLLALLGLQSKGAGAGAWGVFMDTRVEGLHYACGSSSGTTDPAGRFRCPAGEPVTFSIGDIQIGQPIQWETIGVLSLEDILGAAITDNSVRNMARLLITLDDDGDLATGLYINANAHAACEGRTVDFSLSPDDADPFGSQADVPAIVAALTPSRTLADAATADGHLADLNDRVADAMVANEFTSFSFNALNPQVSCVIEGDKISAMVPFGTNLTNLVATFLTTGVSVKVNGVEQVNGVTGNNFTNPVTYTLTAPDGTSTRDFTVAISVMPIQFHYSWQRYYGATTATKLAEIRNYAEDPMDFATGIGRNEALDQVVGLLSFAGKMKTEVTGQEFLGSLMGPGSDGNFFTGDDTFVMHLDADTANSRWVQYGDTTHTTATSSFQYLLNDELYGDSQPVTKWVDGVFGNSDDYVYQNTDYKYDAYNRIIQSDVSLTSDKATPLSLSMRTVVDFGVDGVEKVTVYAGATPTLDYSKTYEYDANGVSVVNVFDNAGIQIGRATLSYGTDGKIAKIMVFNGDGGDGDWTNGNEVIGCPIYGKDGFGADRYVLCAASIMGFFNQNVPVATYVYDATYGYVTTVNGYSDDEVTKVYSMEQEYSVAQPW